MCSCTTLATHLTERERRSRGSWRTHYALVYQPAEGGDPDTAPILQKCFRSEAEAVAWADSQFVVPLRLDEIEVHTGDNAKVLGVIRHERDF